MVKNFYILLVVGLVLAACSGANGNAQAAATKNYPTVSEPTLPTASFTVAPTGTATATPTQTPTATIEPTATPIPTATWAVVGPGEVVAPILLYHHIDPEQTTPRYNVLPEVFAAQMQALEDWGYTTITATQLIDAITNGAPLPPRPIVITFDDGHFSVYENAFPIMQEHGFVGVTYIVANRLKAYGFTGVPQLEEMINAGWEVGSHGYTHSDLTLDHSIAFTEIFASRDTLTQALLQAVKTFAYPFGKFDEYLGSRTMRWGYVGAMGLGTGYTHNQYSIYYLQRMEVQGTYDMEKFASLLPWSTPIQ
jgi:peptidoglycan/xylan/chitin deacetylase (PgdA/CDA1 family)